MKSKVKNRFENININSLSDYIYYFEKLDSKEIIKKIHEKEKILNNFHIKINDDSDLEILKFTLISLKIIIELLDSLNEYEDKLIDWKEILRTLIFEKISMSYVLKNTIRDIRRKDSFRIQSEVKFLLNKWRNLKYKKRIQKSIIDFL